MSGINHRKEVLEEVERLGVSEAIDAAENLVRKVRQEAAAAGLSGNGARPVIGEEDAALAAWAKDYVTSEEGKRVSALIDVRLRARPVEVVATDLSEEVLDALVRGIAGWVNPQLTAIEKRIGELEKKKGITGVAARVGQLEARPSLEDAGVWEEGKSYRRAQVVQDHGAVWICEANTTSRPPSDEWRLWVRRETRRDRR